MNTVKMTGCTLCDMLLPVVDGRHVLKTFDCRTDPPVEGTYKAKCLNLPKPALPDHALVT